MSARPSSADTLLEAEVVDEQGVLRFAMALQKTEFDAGEPVNITFTVTNIGNQNMTIWRSPADFDFVVYNGSNSNLYQLSSFKFLATVVWSVSLDPRDSFGSVLVWPQTCNQTDRNNEGIPVSLGQYFIIGRWHALQTAPLSVLIGKPNSTMVTIVVGVAIVALVAVFVGVALASKKH